MQVPKSWKDITISRFIAAYDILQLNFDSELDKEVAYMAAICNTTEEAILKLPIPEFKRLAKELQFVSDLESIGTRFPKWFAINGRAFRPIADMTKVTAGQYTDLSHFTQQEDGIIHNLHNIMAVVCLPFFQRQYKGYKHERLAAFFKENMSMSIAYPIALFFCAVFLISIPDTLDYSGETELAKMMRKKVNLSGLMNLSNN